MNILDKTEHVLLCKQNIRLIGMFLRRHDISVIYNESHGGLPPARDKFSAELSVSDCVGSTFRTNAEHHSSPLTSKGYVKANMIQPTSAMKISAEGCSTLCCASLY